MTASNPAHQSASRKVFVDGVPVSHLVASKMIRTWFMLENGHTVPVSSREYDAAHSHPGDIHLTEFKG